jgi:hypothetical protein
LLVKEGLNGHPSLLHLRRTCLVRIGPINALQVRELDVPDGSLTIPEDAEEVEVVVDRQPASVRIAVATACLLSLLALVGVGVVERGNIG